MLGSFKVSTDDENTPADGEMSYEAEVMRSVEATRALVRKAEFKSNLHVYLPPLISLRELSAELE